MTGQNVYSSLLSFICLFLCSLMSSFVHTACMCPRKKKSHAGPRKDKIALRVLLLLLQRSCSNCSDAHVHADLEL